MYKSLLSQAVILLATMMIFGCTGSNYSPGDIHVDLRFDRDRYFLGERIMMTIVIRNTTDETCRVTTGSLDHALFGSLVILDRSGKALKASATLCSLGHKQRVPVCPHQSIERIVPMNHYGVRRPVSMTSCPDTGSYTWQLRMPILNEDGVYIDTAQAGGAFSVELWPDSLAGDVGYYEKIAGRRRVHEYHYNEINEIEKITTSERLKILISEKLLYYEKSLGLAKEYAARLDVLETKTAGSIVCEYVVSRQKRSLNGSFGRAVWSYRDKVRK